MYGFIPLTRRCMRTATDSVSPSQLADSAALLTRFERRDPFRHLVLDDFFPAEFAAELLAQFPAFERGNARNEDGAIGGKSVVERIRELGPAYAALDDLVKGKPFLDWLSAATGIPDLRYDPWYFGGGTHDNRHGQDLDPHVDFNRHPEDGSHRRLNLIVYLNREWQDAWGGSLELHTDPRAEDDRITLVTPLFNRCVVFETTEWSWHGFSRIDLPEDRRQLSRKSIALYFYTRERPSEELAPTHSTIYVDRPLPAHLVPGHVLSADDVQALQVLLTRRDMHNQRLYQEVIALQARLESGALGKGPVGHFHRLRLGIRKLREQREAGQAIDRGAVKSAFVPFVHELPTALRQPLRRLWRRTAESPADVVPQPSRPSVSLNELRATRAVEPVTTSTESSEEKLPPEAMPNYAERIEQETGIFADLHDVHALPGIFHYWSNQHLLPLAKEFGFEHPEHYLTQQLLASARRTGTPQPRLVSIGAGNCDAEVRIATSLLKLGLSEFTLECLDINESMLARGREAAREAGVERHIIPVRADFNRWQPVGTYDGIIANQSLHHVLDLEHLFDAVHTAMASGAIFAVSDMIGRNGHLRWPEALAVVQELWAELPARYRDNVMLQRHEHEFMDWDCSTEGFEGVRAQDILRLLIERFGFESFFAYGNIIDPFIDRSFGHHFDAERPWDRDFIDRAHARDEAELKSGRIKPTHMLAALVKDRDASCRFRDNLSPAFCLRAVED